MQTMKFSVTSRFHHFKHQSTVNVGRNLYVIDKDIASSSTRFCSCSLTVFWSVQVHWEVLDKLSVQQMTAPKDVWAESHCLESETWEFQGVLKLNNQSCLPLPSYMWREAQSSEMYVDCRFVSTTRQRGEHKVAQCGEKYVIQHTIFSIAIIYLFQLSLLVHFSDFFTGPANPWDWGLFLLSQVCREATQATGREQQPTFRLWNFNNFHHDVARCYSNKLFFAQHSVLPSPIATIPT